MYINSLDEIFDSIINKFYIYIKKQNIFQKITKDENFVKYKKFILNYIKEFIEKTDIKSIQKIVKTKENLKIIVDILKRYCGYYLYLGLGFFYKGNRDLFITNLIESAKDQLDTTYKIKNLFDSENISKIISFYSIIKDIQLIVKERTLERIKILLYKDPIRFSTIINFLNSLGEDYIIKHFLIENYFHNLLKTIIFRMIYLKEEKNNIIRLISDKEIIDGEYIYIEIEVSKKDKIIDYSILQKMLSIDIKLKEKIDDIYDYLTDIKNKSIMIEDNKKKYKDYFFDRKIIVPITEDFLRYHKDSEKYDPESMLGPEVSIKERDLTKIKYITNKMNKIINYNSNVLLKNPKLKLNIKKLFYKPLNYLDAILYNDIEEIKIIQKLELSDSSADQDLLIDLESYRKYAYVNYKKFSNEGIKLRPNKSIQAIRNTNIKYKDRERKLDLRIGNSSLDLNVIGIALNPYNLPLDIFTNYDLIDIRKKTNNDNGYESMLKMIKEIYKKKMKMGKKIYYWIFDSEKDIAKISSYKNVSKSSNLSINIMIEELYNNFLEIIFNKIILKINETTDLNIWKINNILEEYFERYFDLSKDDQLYYQLYKYCLEKIKIEKDLVDIIDEYIPNNNKLIRLPVVKIEKKVKNIILIDEEKSVKIDHKVVTNPPLCLHHIKFRELSYIKKKNSEFLSQRVFNFNKQYVTLNEKGNYVCKSCGEFLKLRKYVFAGTYVKELDLYLTTQVAVNQDLNNIPKYQKLTRSIRNIGKNIEKISFLSDITYFLGNDNIPKLRRRLAIKDIIDIVMEHTKTIKKLSNNRGDEYQKKYGIKKELSNLFFFDLKDEIFLTSSSDTDYYKLIKYNNILTYILLIIITELNPGQILNLKENKNCNFYLFNKVSKLLFDGLYIRISMKEKILILKIPLLCYVIYYLSFIVTFYNIWLWKKNDDKKGFNINIQKIVINTLVDLINTIRETDLEKDKKFIYESLNAKILDKIKYVFDDRELLDRLEEKSNINIKVKDNKILYVTKKINDIMLDGKMKEISLFYESHNICSSKVVLITGTRKLKINNDLNILTNCPDGRFHSWFMKDNKLTCNLCHQTYEKLKKITDTSTENSNLKLMDNIKKIALRKLAKKYCISGETHEIDINTDKCKLCKKDPLKYSFSESDLNKLNKNVRKKKLENVIRGIEIIRKREQLINDNKNKISDFFNKLDRDFKNVTSDNFSNYSKIFSKKLQKILGKQISDKNKKIYLNETIYYLDHDYLGTVNNMIIKIKDSDNKIKKELNHTFFKKDVLYYLDKNKGYYVYYDSVTLNYLGYSRNNKDIKKLRSKASLRIVYSLSKMIELLGCENIYINLSNYGSFNDTVNRTQIKKIKETVIRNRIRNLKNILLRIATIIYSVIYNKGNNDFNSDRDIINEFTKKIKNIKIKDDNSIIFENIFYVLLGNKFDPIHDSENIKINRNHINSLDINKMDNYDIKIIFYIIHNLEKLLDYNNNPKIRVQLGYMIVKIIIKMYESYYIKYNLIEIRKFNYYLNLPSAYVNETSKGKDHFSQILNQNEVGDIKVEGYYQELVTETKDNSEEIMDLHEESTALDIDDMNDDLYGENNEDL